MALTQIFVDKQLHDIVPIKSRQITPDIYIHLKNNLIQKVEKRCSGAYYVSKVREITKYEDGEMRSEDFSGDVQFKVTYNARICIPTIGSNVVCKIDNLIKLVIMASNGPLTCSIKISETNIDQNVFTIQNADKIISKKTNKELAIGDYIKVTITNHKIFPGQEYIAAFAKIYDIATPDEINGFMFKELEADDAVLVDNDEVIEMNEDNAIDEGIVPIKSAAIRETFIQDI
jgi:DNA-directed RNA polymerase subunit E'/Rpb7